MVAMNTIDAIYMTIPIQQAATTSIMFFLFDVLYIICYFAEKNFILSKLTFYFS